MASECIGQKDESESVAIDKIGIQNIEFRAMNYAVVRVGASQFILEAGKPARIPGIEETKDKSIIFKEVLLLASDGKVQVGTPVLGGVNLQAKVLGQHKGAKLAVFKYKPKSQYRRKIGYRSLLTNVVLEKI